MKTFMRKTITPTLCALLLAALPAFAQFEGVVEMKVTTVSKDGQGGGGTMKIATSKAGSRIEMNMGREGLSMKFVLLQKEDAPNMVYHINDADKTFTEIDVAKAREMAGQQQNTLEYTVEKLGQENLLGYKTQHVLVKEKNPKAGSVHTTEMWTTKGLLSYEAFSKMQARQGQGADRAAMVKALKDAGVDGFPLKSITTTPGSGIQVTMEAVNIEKKSLPAAMFQIPAGYTKSAGSPMMGGLSGAQADEAKQRMQEALKNLSPEQRARIEEMMKQRQTGGQP
jgi:hypothetical protein